MICASWSNDKSIKVWNKINLSCITILIAHSGYVLSIIQSNNGLLAACSDDKTIKL